ncbi:MAG: pseudouridylate synthase [Prevotella sp.]|nr:pseudouridylate synthase [Prevotella sp.]
MTPQFEDINIHELLPQQEPFVLVDHLIWFDEQRTTTRFTVCEDHLMVEDGRLMTCALAENMAQTCAARLGYVNKYILKRDIQIGFIGAVKDMVIHDTPKVGDTLVTTIDVLQQLMNITLAEATVRCDDRIIATAQLKIAMKE